MVGHCERRPDIGGPFTVTPVVAHRKDIAVRLFGEMEGAVVSVLVEPTACNFAVAYNY